MGLKLDYKKNAPFDVRSRLKKKTGFFAIIAKMESN